MSTAELLAMMTPHGVEIGHAHGGIAKLTGIDVAGAMGMADISQGEQQLMLAMYCGDLEALRQLEYSIYLKAVDIAIAKGWKVVRGKEYLRGVCQLAICEIVGHNRCRKCNGTKFNKDHKSCRRCEGSGMEKPVSGNQKADYIDMPRTTWHPVWDGRYVVVLGELQRWHDRACIRISRALKDRDE